MGDSVYFAHKPLLSLRHCLPSELVGWFVKMVASDKQSLNRKFKTHTAERLPLEVYWTSAETEGLIETSWVPYLFFKILQQIPIQKLLVYVRKLACETMLLKTNDPHKENTQKQLN